MKNHSFDPRLLSGRLSKVFFVACSSLVVLWGSLPLLLPSHLFRQTDKPLPDWMILPDQPPGDGWIFQYQDIWGRDWYQLLYVAGEYGVPAFAIDPVKFPDGCQIYWFSKDSNLLSITSSNQLDRIGAGGGYLGSEYPRQIIREDISARTLEAGVRLGLLDQSRRSVFVRVEPASVVTDAWHLPGDPPTPGRYWLIVLCVLVAFAFVCGIIACNQTGQFIYAAIVIIFAFWLAGVLFDRPFSGFGGQIDAGDDSYYLAYAQNLITKGRFFEEPVRIHFGARHIERLHGIPGSGLFLAPATLAESILAGKPFRREIDLNGLRAMRLLSAVFALIAMLFLGRAIHLLEGGVWSVIFPCLLMWSTSLPKWAFQRSIFTHSIEMAFWCATIYFIVTLNRNHKHPFMAGVILGSLTGSLFLVRGEYLLLVPLIPFVSFAALRGLRGRFITGYVAMVACFGGIYFSWINQISTGYGRIGSGHTQTLTNSGFVRGIALVRDNALLLVESYVETGGLLVWAAVVLTVLLLFCARAKAWSIKNLSIPVIGALMVAGFISNAAFHTPLGMEWSHRYSLKLYPLAFLLFLFLLQMASGRAGKVASGLMILIAIVSVSLNIKSFIENIYAKDGGLWVWSDEQVLLGGMASPYGLYHTMSVIFSFVACIFAVVLIGRRRFASMLVLCCMISVVLAARFYITNMFDKKSVPEGLEASFFAGDDFSDLVAVRRLDEFPVFAAGYGFQYPYWPIRGRRHSMVARGWLYAPTSAEYRFFSESKDGIQIFISDEPLIDNWENRSWVGSGRHGQRFLEQGFHPVTINFCVGSRNNDGAFRIKWAGGIIPNNSILAPPYLTVTNLTGSRRD